MVPHLGINQIESESLAVILSLSKLSIESKNGPQIWTRDKILIKGRYLDNGATLRD